MNASWRFPARPLADPAAVIQGPSYRITVLTDGLVRLEHAEDGRFEDRASSFAINRELPVPSFRVIENARTLEIVTDRLHLVYDREPFSTNGLSVQVRGNISNYHSVWRFGQDPGADLSGPVNLGGTARTLDGADGTTVLDRMGEELAIEPGVLSRWGYAVLDDSRSMVFGEDGWPAPRRAGQRHDLYVFAYGLDYLDAISAFHAVSGPVPVLPRYALGTWWSRYHAYDEAEYRELVQRFAAEQIPLSVSVIDMDWHLVDVAPEYGSGWTGYTWNRDLFPDPPGFLAWLRENGLAVTLNVHPADGVRAYEELYPQMTQALGRDPSTGDPIGFDVTDPAFLTAYFEVLHHTLENDGVDFWWLDWQSGPYSRVAGIDPLWVLNHFHYLDSARKREGDERRRGLTFSRYAGPGSHRYPVGFSGDTVVSWASLAYQPQFTATASNIGYGWWSHDIGGHFGGVKDDELTARWVQLGTFSPVLRLHSGNNPFATKEPWAFGTDAREAMTQALRLRHRLVPYLHTMNHRAARESVPLVTPMYWWHPRCAQAYEVANQFRFGSELMVAPITSPRDAALGLGAVRAWLPEGEWADVLTGLRYTGGREIVMHRDLATIPVLARAGAVIPWDATPTCVNGAPHPDAIEVVVVPGEDGAFELIEDDGGGDGLDPHRQVRTRLVWDQSAGRLSVVASGALGCVPATRTWILSVLGAADSAASAAIDGAATEAAVGSGPHGMRVTVRDVPVGSTLTIELGPDPRALPNDVAARAFALLERAQIEYELKTRLYDICAGDAPAGVRVSRMQALGIDRGLELALSEIILARPDPA